MATPGEIIQAVEANGVGWLAWGWDDNNLANCSSDDNWFSMTYHCSAYTQPSDLTVFGRDVVLNPTYGIRCSRNRLNIFRALEIIPFCFFKGSLCVPADEYAAISKYQCKRLAGLMPKLIV